MANRKSGLPSLLHPWRLTVSISNNNTLQEAVHDTTSAGTRVDSTTTTSKSQPTAPWEPTQVLRVYARSPDNSIQEYG
ncbi:uncharacterized protein NFIA_055620 [Aspergillus fischeri NRRL 181]|uniref:Uncharacterized protein n=1 Tax=Neosartorya fischeri (strain ATCC 1020 / DSM 3700 / CBS 544.65 / FGSC A1164 / JCM 1740 / NRRL 181 / WB 181) TaxID=331117 RepID=A1DN42_NEOFI|nr:uncharacterized protein NFIA_055620 [Aspergillus fischeri NRRL 181]EAW16213.1 hypothetical protein NFIA_055620 [Aspergillus fischeri NRRL 181]KAG2005112.1 hypothetical protein GB937_009070 [Aspergillus fischeri]